MSSEIQALAALVRELQAADSLEAMLKIVVERAASLLEVERVSIRLLDATRARLIAVCRVGEPLHRNPVTEFRLGEGLMGWIAEHARPIRSGDATTDGRFAPKPDMTEQPASFLGVPLMTGPICFGVLNLLHPQPGHFTQHHEDLLTLIAGLCAPYLEIARLTRLALIDALTGVLNRRGLDLAFESALPRHSAELSPDEGSLPFPLSVVLVDIDHFKRVNDEHGHAAGDEVLRQIAATLASVVRGGDGVVRYGGEEFLLVLPGTDLTQAVRTAERLRTSVAAATFSLGGGLVGHLTISAGVAAWRTGEDRQALIDRADAALYVAKQSGRNRVEVS